MAASLGRDRYHIANHADGRPYWREDACYVLREAEVEMLHNAAIEAQRMIDDAVARVFEQGRIKSLLPPAARNARD